MKLYVNNETICRRENILSSYKSKPIGNRDMHMFCDVCDKKCQVVDCENLSQHIIHIIRLNFQIVHQTQVERMIMICFQIPIRNK